MGFYIHIADPGFPDQPFPGERRLGPYDTQEEALNQAAQDYAQGAGTALGIYDEASEVTENDQQVLQKGSPIYNQDKIIEVGKQEVQRRALEAENAVKEVADQDTYINSLIKSGATAAELREAGLLK